MEYDAYIRFYARRDDDDDDGDKWMENRGEHHRRYAIKKKDILLMHLFSMASGIQQTPVYIWNSGIIIICIISVAVGQCDVNYIARLPVTSHEHSN